MADKITLTQDHLKKMGLSDSVIATWYGPLKAAVEKFGIDTGLRLSGFFSNVLHECGKFTRFTENLNYSAQGLVSTFPKYFPSTASTSGYARNPTAIANKVYANRMGNGSETSGDGWKYKGRGLIQITGKSNYKDASKGIGTDILTNPENALVPANSAMVAAWFFSSKGCNTYSDGDNIKGMRVRINGGTKGLDEVTTFYEQCKIIFGVKPGDVDPDVFKRRPTPNAKHGSFSEATGSGNTSLSGANPSYPWNWVWESRSHHIFEVDDTPGAERIHMMHRTGTYTEIGPLGIRVDKNVLDHYTFTNEDEYRYVGGDESVKVDGQSYQKYAGDYVASTDGEMFLESQSRVQVNAPMLSVRELITTPDIVLDTGTINDILRGWVQNAKFAETARTLGGTPLEFESESSSSSGSAAPINVPEDNSRVDMNVPTVFNSGVTMSQPINFGSAGGDAADTGHSIAVKADTSSTSGYSLCYSVNGNWYRASNNSLLT